MIKFIAIAIPGALLISEPALAAEAAALPRVATPSLSELINEPHLAGVPESHITTYGGFYSASNGYADRYVVGSFIDWQLGATGLHADLLYVDREQNAAYAAVGASQMIEGFGRIKVMVGTSTGQQNILPDRYASLGMEIQPVSGLILRPGIAYRHFRSGASQVSPSLQVAEYFGGGGGYFVAQGDAAMFITNSGRTGWSLAGGLTHVEPNGLRLGIAVRRGYMAYDSVIGTEVHSKFYGGGPNIGYRFAGGHEIFVRSDVTKTRFYTVTGAVVGYKLPL